MAFQLRPYQAEALAALEDYWRTGGGNPLLVMGTATGKSLVIGWLIRDTLQRFPDLRILALTHVQELLGQNLRHLLDIWPSAPAAVNCAALNRRDCGHRILFASIQSVFRNPAALGQRDLVLIDECHLVPHDDRGMYRSLLTALRAVVPDLRVCGLTATPFRLDSGRLDQGEDRIFDDVIFDYGIGDGIRDGWLSPLRSKATTTQIDISGVGRRGGEFIESELQDAADIAAVVNGACDEIVTLGAGRRSWLVFCTGIRHAEHVRDALRARGVTAECVFGETPQDERERIVAAFRAGTITCVVNVMVLTTGFDVPQIDLLVMLRPTLSTGLYVQQVGRGTRRAEGKTDCLILDFAQNVYRHGPVDQVNIKLINKKSDVSVKPETVRAKVCADCSEINSIATYTCSNCGFEWPQPAPKPKHATQADVVSILSTQPNWLKVDSVSFHLHRKWADPVAPPCLRVEYLVGLSTYAEYVSLERQGYARTFAEKWWFAMGGEPPVPLTVLEAIDRSCELSKVLGVSVVRNGKFWNIVERRVRRCDGDVVEVDRNFRCWTANSRAAAAVMPSPPIIDEVPW
jgi:DNA repair protein RadD